MRRKKKLEAVSTDIEQLGKHTDKLKETKADLTHANVALNDAIAKENAAKQRVAAAQEELDAAAVALETLEREQKERAASLLKLKDNEKKCAATEKLAKKAITQNERVRELHAQIEKLPNVTPTKLKKLQDLSVRIREHETKLEAIGLTVELKPDAAAKLTVTDDGKPEKLTLKAGASRKQSMLQRTLICN